MGCRSATQDLDIYAKAINTKSILLSKLLYIITAKQYGCRVTFKIQYGDQKSQATRSYLVEGAVAVRQELLVVAEAAGEEVVQLQVEAGEEEQHQKGHLKNFPRFAK